MVKVTFVLRCWSFTASGLLSVTRTITELVLGPCASVGIQEIAPVAGSMFMPAGGARSEKVSGFFGKSTSVADAETLSGVSSSTGVFAGTVNTGATFTSLTTTVNVFVRVKKLTFTM